MTEPIKSNPALAYWGVINSAAGQHATTAQLWEGIRAAATDLGLDSPGVSASQVGQVRAYATAIANAAADISQAADSLSMSNFNIPTAPFSRSLVERNTSALYQVTFTMQTMGPEGVSIDYRTAMTQQLPATIGDLNDLINDAASGMAQDYGVALVSSDFVSIIAR